MRTSILLVLLLLLAACATPPGTAPKLPPPSVPMPPTPAPLAMMKRQSVRAFAASPVEIEAPPSGVANTDSPSYGVSTTFPVEYENGKKGIGIYVVWNNWPSNTPYVIERSTNLVDWTELVFSEGDEGRVLVNFDLVHGEFYRIIDKP